MAVYKGVRKTDEEIVTKNGSKLSPKPSQEICNHSPDGFSWGYPGSGPAQLALALLYDVTGDKELSETYHHVFKWEHVNRWEDTWEITDEEIKEWLEAVEKA